MRNEYCSYWSNEVIQMTDYTQDMEQLEKEIRQEARERAHNLFLIKDDVNFLLGFLGALDTTCAEHPTVKVDADFVGSITSEALDRLRQIKGRLEKC